MADFAEFEFDPLQHSIEVYEWIQEWQQTNPDTTDEELLMIRLRSKERDLKRIKDIIKEWWKRYPFNTWLHGELMEQYRVVLDVLDLPYPEAQ